VKALNIYKHYKQEYPITLPMVELCQMVYVYRHTQHKKTVELRFHKTHGDYTVVCTYQENIYSILSPRWI